MKEEELARGTCRSFLTAAQLKDICRYRRFGAPPSGKDDLAAYVAARLNGPEGVPGNPIPANVSAELEAWCGHGHKLVFFGDDTALVELRGDSRDRVLEDVRKYVVDEGEGGFAVVRTPDKVFEILEQKLHVPTRVKHPEGRLAPTGFFETAAPRSAPAVRPPAEPPVKVRLESEDLVGYRSAHRPLLEALAKEIREDGATCRLDEDEDLLIVSAAALPKFRAALRKLSHRFEVVMAARSADGKK
jgi:hypothetical protein